LLILSRKALKCLSYHVCKRWDTLRNCSRLSDSNGENMEHVRYLRLSHIHDYVTYAAHGRQYLVEVYVVR